MTTKVPFIQAGKTDIHSDMGESEQNPTDVEFAQPLQQTLCQSVQYSVTDVVCVCMALLYTSPSVHYHCQ